METRKLNFKDGLEFGDAAGKDKFEEIMNSAPDGMGLRGMVVFKTPQGKVLLVKKNLVVLRGRTFALENLFDMDLDETFPPDYAINRARKICLFKVGRGGTLPDDPFNPIVVQPLERDLADPAPFRTLVPGLGDAFVGEEGDRYFGENIIVGGPDGDVMEYYFKRINVSTSFNPEWEYDQQTNTVAVKMVLKLDDNDTEGMLINELGMFAAEMGVETGTGKVTFKDPEMVSRITFDTEAMKGNKEILIDYYIFA